MKPVYTKMIISRFREIEMSNLSKSRFCQNWQLRTRVINLYTENSYNQSTSKLIKMSILTKIVKIDDFEQNWRFRQIWHFWHKLVNLYTGLYTNPMYPNRHLPPNTENSDFECSSHLTNPNKSRPLLSTFSISWKSRNRTQKLKFLIRNFNNMSTFVDDSVDLREILKSTQVTPQNRHFMINS